MSQQQQRQVNALNANNNVIADMLKQWIEECTHNSKQKFAYRKALKSVLECKDAIQSRKDAERLDGIGPTISKRIEERLKEANILMEEEESLSQTNTTFNNSSSNRQNTALETITGDERKKRPYVPAYRSGGYAILIALHINTLTSHFNFMSRSQITKEAQHYCDASFETTQASSYSAWNSVNTLVKNGLVAVDGNPKRYCLTESGELLAAKLYAAASDNKSHQSKQSKQPHQLNSNSNQAPLSQQYHQSQTSYHPHPSIINETGFVDQYQSFDSSQKYSAATQINYIEMRDFEVLLLLDNREMKGRNDRGYLQQELTKLSIPFLTRTLELGDFLWIARDKRDPAIEIVLDFIVERKRGDDFVHSIVDGRYTEQKFRLSNCGLRNVFYVIEPISKQDSEKLAGNAVQAAITNTLVRDGFFVKLTSGIDETIRYIALLNTQIEALYKQQKLLYGIPDNALFDLDYGKQRETLETETKRTLLPSFSAFMSASRKATNKISELFLKQLLSIKGITAEKAMSLKDTYGTMERLMNDVYGNENVKNRISEITYGEKKIGKKMAETIVEYLNS